MARGGVVLASRWRAESRSSTILLALVDAALAAAGVAPGELSGIAAVAGPGSFTGTRVTLATALGLRLGTAAPAVAVSTLEALALAAREPRETLLAAVDALRGAWFVQRFDSSDGAHPGAIRALEAPRRLEAIDPPERGVALVVGFGLDALAPERVPGAMRETPEALAQAVAAAASLGRWPLDERAPLRPIYLAAPNVSRAGT